MSDNDNYTPPKVWTWEQGSGGKFANINAPTAGAREEKPLPVGKHSVTMPFLASGLFSQKLFLPHPVHVLLGLEP